MHGQTGVQIDPHEPLISCSSTSPSHDHFRVGFEVQVSFGISSSFGSSRLCQQQYYLLGHETACRDLALAREEQVDSQHDPGCRSENNDGRPDDPQLGSRTDAKLQVSPGREAGRDNDPTGQREARGALLFLLGTRNYGAGRAT